MTVDPYVVVVLLYFLTVGGALAISALSRRLAERRRIRDLKASLRDLERGDVRDWRAIPMYEPASLRPFYLWLAAAFVAGVLTAFLAQRIALSAEPTTQASGSGCVASSAKGVTYAPHRVLIAADVSVDVPPGMDHAGRVSRKGRPVWPGGVEL